MDVKPYVTLKPVVIMDMLSFMEEKALEKGMNQCQNCGEPDIFFALNGVCMECKSPIPRYSEVKSFQFALEVFTEFIDKFDTINDREKKLPALNHFKELITAVKDNSELPSNENLSRLQFFIDNLGSIGGEKIGGLVTVENGKPSLTLSDSYKPSQNEGPLTRIKSLTAALTAIQHIQSVSVPTEQDITSKATSNRIVEPIKVDADNSNMGCLSVITAIGVSLGCLVLITSVMT